MGHAKPPASQKPRDKVEGFAAELHDMRQAERDELAAEYEKYSGRRPTVVNFLGQAHNDAHLNPDQRRRVESNRQAEAFNSQSRAF